MKIVLSSVVLSPGPDAVQSVWYRPEYCRRLSIAGELVDNVDGVRTGCVVFGVIPSYTYGATRQHGASGATWRYVMLQGTFTQCSAFGVNDIDMVRYHGLTLHVHNMGMLHVLSITLHATHRSTRPGM